MTESEFSSIYALMREIVNNATLFCHHMASVSPQASIRDFQQFISDVYTLPNNRHFDLGDMLTNIQRFAMRGLKGIRKGDHEKAARNLIISYSWFMSLMVRMHIDLENEVWQRFPYLCSYCGSCPCVCRVRRVEKRQNVPVDDSRRPTSIAAFQRMFNAVYPSDSRSLAHAGVHLAEEIGEFSEALLAYRSERSEEDFKEVMLEAADYYSCLNGVFNSLGVDLAQTLASTYHNNCHECHAAPCICTFSIVKRYKS